VSRLQRESPASPFVFVSERGSPLATAGFAKMVNRAGEAGFDFKAHPNMFHAAHQQTVVADAVKAGWQDVDQEPADVASG
jgi:hypothetical protein